MAKNNVKSGSAGTSMSEPDLIVIRFGRRIGEPKRVPRVSAKAFTKKAAENMAQKGYTRLLSTGHSPEMAREYHDNLIEALVGS